MVNPRLDPLNAQQQLFLVCQLRLWLWLWLRLRLRLRLVRQLVDGIACLPGRLDSSLGLPALSL